MRRARRAWGRRDDGAIGILTLGFAVLAIMLILVVAAVSAVHLARLRLNHLADELAEDASDALDPGAYYGASEPIDPTLAQQLMADAVERHVATRGTGHLEGVRLVGVDAGEDQTATVTIEVTVYPLFGLEALMPFADGITLTATGQSRTF